MNDNSLLIIGVLWLLSYVGLAFGDDNEINLVQSGDNFSLTIEQIGYGNSISSIGDLLGANNTLDLNQGIKGNNDIDLAISGYSNTIIIGQEKIYSNGVWSNDTNSYGNHYAKADLSGNYNDVNIIQRNNNSSVAGHNSYAIVTNGDYNSITTLQTGTGGSNGHTSYVHVKNGRDGNTVDVFQNSDTADHRATLSIYSNDNIIDVNQTGTSANTAYVLFSHQSVGPTTFTLNQTGGATYGSTSYVTQYCANANGCSVTVTQGN